MNGCTVAFASVAARFTANGTNSPCSASTTCSAIVCPALSCASTVDAPRCGVTTTESSSNSGDSVVGSASNTSSAAPAMRPSRIGVGERGFVDDAAARGVDDAQRGLGVPEQLGRDHPDGLGRLRQRMREEVGAAHELLDRRHELDAELTRPIGAHVRVDGRRSACRTRAHAARRAHRRARARRCRASCRAARRPPTSRGSTRRCVRSRSAWGMLRAFASSIAIVCSAADSTFDCGRVHDHHAAAGGGIDVDVVERRCRRGRPRRRLVAGLEHFRGDLRRAADHQRRGARARRSSSSAGERSSCTSTSSPATRIASRPLSASFSATRTRHRSR